MPSSTTSKSIVGIGWSFPPCFLHETRSCTTVTDGDDIEQSLHILLHTRPGERPLLPEYGCDLQLYLFEPMSTAVATLIRDAVKRAVNRYEPRIDLLSVNVATDAATAIMTVALDYVVSSTNSRFNKVYPFYLEEGTHVAK